MKKAFHAKAGGTAKKPFDRLEETDPERALVRYAEIGDLAGVRRMLAAQADVNAVIFFNNGVETVEDTGLHAAAGGGHVAVVAALIEAGADINAKINDDETPLIQAAMNGWAQTVERLVREKAEIDHAETFDGYTALHWASRLGREGTVKVLLAAGADMSVKSKQGETAEDMICAQIGMGHQEYQVLYDKIQDAFQGAHENRRRAAETALREKDMLAAALAHAPVLQKEISVGKPLRLKPRHF